MNFLSAFLLLSLLTPFAHSAGQTGKGTIEVMYVNAGWTQVRVPAIDNSKNNPDNCAKAYYFAIHPNDTNYDAFHATLLSAQISKREVQFWVSGCGGQNSDFPYIRSVWLH